MGKDDQPLYVISHVPSAPGFFIAMFVADHDGNDGQFFYEPLIAWEILRGRGDTGKKWFTYYSIEPLTAHGSMEMTSNVWCVKRPDGVFDFLEDTSFDTLDKALAYAKKLDDKRK